MLHVFTIYGKFTFSSVLCQRTICLCYVTSLIHFMYQFSYYFNKYLVQIICKNALFIIKYILRHLNFLRSEVLCIYKRDLLSPKLSVFWRLLFLIFKVKDWKLHSIYLSLVRISSRISLRVL